jgi:hypothetical protein
LPATEFQLLDIRITAQFLLRAPCPTAIKFLSCSEAPARKRTSTSPSRDSAWVAVGLNETEALEAALTLWGAKGATVEINSAYEKTRDTHTERWREAVRGNFIELTFLTIMSEKRPASGTTRQAKANPGYYITRTVSGLCGKLRALNRLDQMCISDGWLSQEIHPQFPSVLIRV